jgi:hypothetical protein
MLVGRIFSREVKNSKMFVLEQRNGFGHREYLSSCLMRVPPARDEAGAGLPMADEALKPNPKYLRTTEFLHVLGGLVTDVRLYQQRCRRLADSTPKQTTAPVREACLRAPKR